MVQTFETLKKLEKTINFYFFFNVYFYRKEIKMLGYHINDLIIIIKENGFVIKEKGSNVVGDFEIYLKNIDGVEVDITIYNR